MKYFRLLAAVLREIFEESAYARFCATEGVPRGRASYARFLREWAGQNGVKVRCC